METVKKTVPFNGTKEQEEQLLAVIAELKSQPGCLMPIMQKAQDIYGYLPIEVQTIIADELGIPLEKVYGVATFYAQFALYPKGKYKISVCLGHRSLSRYRLLRKGFRRFIQRSHGKAWYCRW